MITATWRCELGRGWILHRGAAYLDPPVTFISAFANYQFCVFALCKEHAHEMCLWRRVFRSRLWGLARAP